MPALRSPGGSEGVFLTLFTDEPFSGSIYSRTHPGPPCRANGNGVTKITRLTLAPDTCGVHNVTIDINSKNKSQKDRIRDLWLNDGIMERLDFKNDGARLHEGGSNGSSVRHVKQVIREVSVYIQRDKELQQASDAQFLVQVLLHSTQCNAARTT